MSKKKKKKSKKKPLKKQGSAEQAIAGCLKAIGDQHLSVPEIVDVFTNVLYAVGASIEGFKDTGPSIPDVIDMYYSKPGRVGIAMMAQAIHMNQEWHKSLVQTMEQTENASLGTDNNRSETRAGMAYTSPAEISGTSNECDMPSDNGEDS